MNVHAQVETPTEAVANPSGIVPTGWRVLVKPMKVATKIRNIELPDEAIHRKKFATHTGLLIAVGGGAFKPKGPNDHSWDGEIPRPGDWVLYPRYGGELRKGVDGEEYRLIDDQDIPAVTPGGPIDADNV